jgi:hypothetical protein
MQVKKRTATFDLLMFGWAIVLLQNRCRSNYTATFAIAATNGVTSSSTGSAAQTNTCSTQA